MTIYEVSVDRDGKRRSVGYFARFQDAADIAGLVSGEASAVEVYTTKQQWVEAEALERRARVLAKLTDEERALLGVS